jgi:hypothetical protein
MNHFARFVLTGALLLQVVGQSSICLAADPDIRLWSDRARAAAGEISDLQARNLISDPLARMLARSGDVAGAFAAAKGIADPLPKIYVLTAVAKAAHQAGNKTVCQQAVDAGKQDAIDNAGPFYTSAYIELCFAAGLPQAAMEFADSVFKTDSDPQTYQDIVQRYAASGDVAAAERLLKEKNLGDYGKHSLVQGLVEAKDYDAATKVADTIEDQQPADRAHSAIATALAHEGQKDLAKKQAALLTEPLERNGLLGEVELFSSRKDSVDELRKSFAAATTRDTKTQ